MRQKWKVCAAVGLMAFGLSATFSTGVNAAGTDVPLDSTTFPDEIFRSYVAQFDKDGSESLSRAELDAVTVMNVSGFQSGGWDSENVVKKLDGIQYFTKLQRLSCGDNEIKSLDLSKNKDLVFLWCNDNCLESLDVSSLTKLQDLNCEHNQIKTLTVSANKDLQQLDCSGNELETLDVSALTKLEHLGVSHNKLTSLKVNGANALKSLECGSNHLTGLDISQLSKLTWLVCSGNQLTKLDFSQNTALKDVQCQSNVSLTELIVNKAVEELNCSSTNITSLDLSKATKLKGLICDTTKLEELDLEKNTELDGLSCWDCKIGTLKLGKKPKMTDLYIYKNAIASLDLTGATALQRIECYGNNLTELDLSASYDMVGLVKEAPIKVDDYDGYRVDCYGKEEGSKELSIVADRDLMITAIHVHTAVKDAAVAATYTKTGLTEGSHCSVCGAVIKKQKVVPKLVKNGWLKESGSWFYYVKGVKQKGWKKLGKWYFFKSNGVMAANEWCQGYWLNKDGSCTYAGKASWKKDSKGWWYGDNKGWYAKKCWQKIDSKWYYFDEKGYIVTGTRKIGGKTYRFSADGVCLNP